MSGKFPWTTIKAKLATLVKARAAIPIVILLVIAAPVAAPAVAEETEPKATTAPSPEPTSASVSDTDNSDDAVTPAKEPENPPDIEARTFGIKVIKRSSSNRTYLFDDVTDAKPAPGRILLVKRENDPVMAFRVLKNYPEKKQFAAKRIRRYGGNKVLEKDSSYLAVEKLGDLALESLPPETTGATTPPEPTGSKQEKSDLQEIEEKPPSYDPELDAGNSPAPHDSAADVKKQQPPVEGTGTEEDDDRSLEGTVEEVNSLERYRHGFSAEGGYFHNNPGPKSNGTFSGMGFRYAFTLGKMLFLRKAAPQDSLSVEAGVFLYKVQGYINLTDASKMDSYTVVPIVGTVRYNVHFNEDFSLFAYGGFVKNRIVASSQAPDQGTLLLNSTLPAVGGGISFRVGPGWYIRGDFGIDMMGAALFLRF